MSFRNGFANRVASSHRRSRPRFEQLEDRLTPATIWYVDDSNLGSEDGSLANPFNTISEAVTAASNNDTINVAVGTYNELVVIDKTLTLNGARQGVDARTRTGAESIVSNAAGDFQILADGVVIDGFTIRDVSTNLNAGVHIAPTNSGYNVKNNIITNNVIGIYANSDAAATIFRNLFNANNTAGPAGGSGIYSESTVSLTIDENEFKNHNAGNPILFGATGLAAHTNLQVTDNNLHDNTNATGIYALAISGGNFQNNTITTEGTATALSLSGGNTNVTVTGNVFTDNLRGLRIIDFGDLGGGTPNSAITVTDNSFTANTSYALGNLDDGGGGLGYTGGPLNASGNYWGTSNPASILLASTGPLTSTIDFTPLLDKNETAANQSVVGFQFNHSSVTVHTLGGQTGVVGRINEGVALVPSFGTVNILTGSYTENVDTTTNNVTLVPGASPGQVTINGTLTLDNNDTVKMEILGTTAGTGYDQFVVSGTVTLGSAALNLSFGSFHPALGNLFVLIQTPNPIVNAFAGFAEGATFKQAGVTLKASYLGATGTGTDFVIASAAPTKTTVSALATSYRPTDQVLNLYATVKWGPASNRLLDGGTVTFKVVDSRGAVIGTPVTSGPVTLSEAFASYTLPGHSPAGNYRILATYSGALAYQTGKQASAQLKVNKAPTTTSMITANATYNAAAQTVTLDAKVYSVFGPVDEGKVTFTVRTSAGTRSFTAPVIPTGSPLTGHAIVNATLPAGMWAGTYTVTAKYRDNNFLDSTGVGELTVARAAAIAVADDLLVTASIANQQITLTVTLSSAAGIVKGGMVTFTVSGIGVVTKSVAGNVVTAKFTIPGGTPTGAYTITADFTGAGNFLEATDTATLTIDP